MSSVIRVLAIESSGPVASVALIEAGQVVVRRRNVEPHTHAERLLHLVDACLAEASVDKRDLDRIAVGVGPGSFTGLRVGIALAQGLALGLGATLVGVPSLSAMAMAARNEAEERTLCPVVDARRTEVFAAAYAPDGRELWGARTFPADASDALRAALGEGPYVGVGAMAEQLFGAEMALRGDFRDGPDAGFVGLLGEKAAETPDVTPIYARGANAVRPVLPPNPLAGTER